MFKANIILVKAKTQSFNMLNNLRLDLLAICISDKIANKINIIIWPIILIDTIVIDAFHK